MPYGEFGRGTVELIHQNLIEGFRRPDRKHTKRAPDECSSSALVYGLEPIRLCRVGLNLQPRGSNEIYFVAALPVNWLTWPSKGL